MLQHQFPAHVIWHGGRNEVGQLRGNVINQEVSIPSSLGGRGTGTNPDELLVSAAASCMTISLAATLERAHLTALKIHMHSYGHAQFDQHRFTMTRIVHQPHIYVANASQYTQLEKRLPKLIQIAHQNCMVSHSLRGNVDIEIHPTLIVAE
ncbi:SACOL1771 family peroxiredoxin [Staphylococcus lutrae]|uniref:Peroxiredoxin n=1 Tax=Staphylococcus lutrae TaxID=155085 RepID=A0AAC9WIR1_9STAP|nr:SACOL1771 family peroxiredoxin [Staphylococcus lutrae]ARJ50011.1 peroxiredoxin [Staphylococcus lutrae]PNZ36402.1 peroxiredoxin [Staphylococcus lutrae]